MHTGNAINVKVKCPHNNKYEEEYTLNQDERGRKKTKYYFLPLKLWLLLLDRVGNPPVEPSG